MAQDQFIALIEGRADLSKAKQDFDSFKKQIEQPIKLTFDASGFNAVWGNIKQQAQQAGANVGKQFGQGIQNNVKNTRLSIDPKIKLQTGNDPIANFLKMDSKLADDLVSQLQRIKDEGGKLQSFKLGNGGNSFEAMIKNGDAMVRVISRLEEETDAFGNKTGNMVWGKPNVESMVDYTNAIKQAQSEADKLAQSFNKIQDSFKNGTFDSGFEANIKKMESNFATLSADAFKSENTKKAIDAATEYQRIMLEIQETLNGTAVNPLTDEQVVAQYQKAMAVLKQYGDVWKIVRIEQGETISQSQANKNADAVQAWCNRNSKALKQYGKELDEIQEKMRNTFDANEQKALQERAQQIYKRAGAEGQTGLSFGDQVKKAFNKIGQFTWIYAITSQIRQVPQEMVQEVIKIDTAMTELRKVSTASASEIRDYFEQATDSAAKYGQTINEVIDSTASWTRLGYNLDDAKTLTDVTAQLAQVGSGLNVDTATEGLQATIKGFGLAADEAKRVGDMINYVADTEPIDALGIINGLERSSAVMRETNNSLEETMGLITATTSVTQDATSAGTAWRTVALRITGAKNELEAAGLETDGMVESTAKLRDEIMAVAGVDILDATGKNFKSVTQIMRELAQVWDSLDEIEKNGLLDKIAGKRGAVAVSAALQNWDIVEKTIKGASEESVGSMDQQLEIYNQSIQASLDKFKVAFQELSVDLINSDFIKGVVDTGTAIIKFIDELVEHIGVLGTALTGLGIANTIGTIVSGAKSVEGTGKALSLAFDAITSGSTTAAQRTAALNNALTALKNSGVGAGTALKGTASSIVSLAASYPLLTAGILGAVAAFTAFSYIKHRSAEIDKQASASAEEWNKSKTAIQDYVTEYKTLKDNLKDTNLSEAERIGIKQQLLDLQNQIVSLYGDEVRGIDLVNGGLSTQEEILARIAQQKAKDNINDNFIGYYRAEDAMTQDRTYRVAGVRNSSAKLQEEYARIFNSDKVKDMFKLDETTMNWVFTGDASEADEAFKIVTDDLEKLKKGASESDTNAIQKTIDSITKSATENQKILTKYRDTYNAYLEQQVFEQGFGDEASEYAKRIQEYNDALLGGDLETIVAKRSEVLDYYDNTIKNILGEHDEFTDYFSGIREQIDTSSEALIDWKDIVEHDTPAAGNTFAKSADKIKSTINELKKLELDSVDIQAILGNPENVNYGLLEQLAKLWNPDIDLSDSTQRSAFADFLAQLGIGAQDAAGNIDLVKSEFDDFLRLASTSIETLEKANAALVNSFGNKGLSMGIDAKTGEITGDVAAIIAAYKDLDGYDASVLFERTADGINVNTEALRALQSEQEATIKADFVRKIAEAQVELGKAGSAEAKQYWEDQLETVKLLSTAYDGATSSYQKWIDAQKMTSPGSKYDTIVDSALKQAKDYYDKGLVGNPVFQSIAQLFTNEDLSLATTEEITKAYEDGLKVVSKYFTTGQEGAKAFADKLVELNLAKKEGDEYDFSESGINTTELANELGISVDLVEAAFGKLQEYGWTINFLDDDQVTKLGELGQKASEARDKLAELADEEGKVGSTDVSSVVDIDISGLDTIDECNAAIEQINDAKANAEVDSDEYEYLESLLQDITLMRDVLEQGSKPTVDDSDLVSVQKTYDSLVSRMTLLDNMNSAPGVDIDIANDEEVRELAETLLDIDDEEYKAKLGIDGIDTVDGIIEKLKEEHINIPVTTDTSGVQTSVNASGTVDYSTGSVEAVGAQSSVVNYTTGTIEPIPVQTAKIDYSTDKIQKIDNQKAKIDYSIGSLPSIPNPSATINYTANITGLNALPKDGDRRDVYIDVHTNKLYKGTVTQSAFQNMSSSGGVTGGSSHANGTLGRVGLKRDENALINELGAEIVVRPSEDSWMIFNDGKPTFASLKKDDVIFNAELTKQLLEKGKADDYARILAGGSHVRGTVKGKAHAVVTGRGKFKTPKNTTKKKNNGGGGGGGGGGGTSPKEAKDFKETLDEIEILLDRIERRISNLDTVASNTFNSLGVRNSALSKSLALVSKEIDNQRAGYKRYIAQANKVGLDSKLAEKVRNGKINIEDIKDEKVWKKVEAYRKW